MEHSNQVPYSFISLDDNQRIKRSLDFYKSMNSRRSVRTFSNTPIPKSVIENIIKTASSAPSGAHKQPWKFVVVSSASIKKEIRKAAEVEEHLNYHGRMNSAWLKDLEVFETNEYKPFLEHAPYLIIVFSENYRVEADGSRGRNYYVKESVGIATGFLISAIHQAGLATLTHTPSPLAFLQNILDRPGNEKPFLLLPVGLPAEGTTVPDISRKSLEECSIWFE